MKRRQVPTRNIFHSRRMEDSPQYTICERNLTFAAVLKAHVFETQESAKMAVAAKGILCWDKVTPDDGGSVNATKYDKNIGDREAKSNKYYYNYPTTICTLRYGYLKDPRWEA